MSRDRECLMKKFSHFKSRKGPFLNLCEDRIFRFFLKSDPSLSLLRSLLETFLPLPKGRKIRKIKIVDPVIESQKKGGKQVILDLRVQLDNKEWVNVEMQAFPQEGFLKRAIYYLTKIFGGLLPKGEKYTEIHSAYSLIFAGFVMFKDSEDHIHTFSLRSDKHPFRRLSDALNITVVELVKFLEKNPKNLVDMKAAWCYLLKESGGMSMKEAQILSEKGEDMKQATDHLIRLSKDEKAMLYEEALFKEKADRLSREDYVRKEGRQEGMQQGRQEGMQQGRQEGMQQGRQEGIEQGMQQGRQDRDREVVLNMLQKGLDISLISEVTGLSPEEIKKLRNGN